MNLIVDAGNTNIVFGLTNGKYWDKTWRLDSDSQQSVPFFEISIRNHLLELGIKPNRIQKVILSSVVPSLNVKIISALNSIASFEIMPIDSHFIKKLPFNVPKPDEIGSDLVANAYKTWKTHPLPAVVVDFGTALSFTVVTKKGIEGVIISPGLKTAVNSLFSKTAQLPYVPLSYPHSVIGKSTNHAIQSGVLIGYVGLVRHLLNEIDQELGQKTYKLATGGLHSIIKPLESEFDLTDINLTLNGLALLGNSEF